MNLQSFVATTAAVSLGLAAVGAGALATLRERPAAAPPPALVSVEPAPAAPEPPRPPDAATPPAAPTPPPQAAPARRQLAQAAPRHRAAHEHARAVHSVRAGDEARSVVALPPAYYPAYAWRPSPGYYRAW